MYESFLNEFLFFMFTTEKSYKGGSSAARFMATIRILLKH